MTVDADNAGGMSEEVVCPLCVGRPNDVVVELDAGWIVAPRRAPLPGYVAVVARSHAGEPFELGGLERRRFWNEIPVAAKAVRDATGCDRDHLRDRRSSSRACERAPVPEGSR